MSQEILDRWVGYLESANDGTYHGEQKGKLLHRILFDGKHVDQVTYDHACTLYNITINRRDAGDMHNARIFLYHCARNVGVL